uniref:Uncharacterized protein n=1 Tax=Anguilla anguilla TaxID=7936 RepID=A0A0E9Q391_ANGAN
MLGCVYVLGVQVGVVCAVFMCVQAVRQASTASLMIM